MLSFYRTLALSWSVSIDHDYSYVRRGLGLKPVSDVFMVDVKIPRYAGSMPPRTAKITWSISTRACPAPTLISANSSAVGGGTSPTASVACFQTGDGAVAESIEYKEEDAKC